jgi:outer membrane biogenesis lipoprotein LolB
MKSSVLTVVILVLLAACSRRTPQQQLEEQRSKVYTLTQQYFGQFLVYRRMTPCNPLILFKCPI